MIEVRRGTVISATERHPGLMECVVEGFAEPALAVLDLTGPVCAGDRVILNTSAVTLDLGTGGFHFVIAIEGGADIALERTSHAMKLRYTPVQLPVRAYEESDVLPESLEGTPVIAAGLHSSVLPALIGVMTTRPNSRVGYVHTDGAALPLVISDVIAALRSQRRLHVCVTTGQAFGGDIEAINNHSGMLAAKAAGAEIIIAAMGPGNLGTSSKYGFASLEQAEILNAAGALGGRPVAVPRVGLADTRARHQIVSHHTLTALASPTFVRSHIALPEFEEPFASQVRRALEPLSAKHEIVQVSIAHCEDALRREAGLTTMGRNYQADPAYFRTAAASGVLAAQFVEALHRGN